MTTETKKRAKRRILQLPAVDCAYVVSYFGVPAKMTSYTRPTSMGNSYVYFKPEPTEANEGRLRSGIEYFKLGVGAYRNPSNWREVIRAEDMEPEIVRLVAYLKDPPKVRVRRSPIKKIS